MKIHQVVEFHQPVQCKRDNTEQSTICCEHKAAKKKKDMPCRQCLGVNRRDGNVLDEYPVDEYDRRVTVISPEEWQSRKGG